MMTATGWIGTGAWYYSDKFKHFFSTKGMPPVSLKLNTAHSTLHLSIFFVKREVINNLDETKCEKARHRIIIRWNYTRRVQFLLRAHTVGWPALRISHANKWAETNELLPIAKLGAETDRWSTRATDPKAQQIPLVLFLLAEKKSTIDPTWYTASTYSIAVFLSIRLRIQRTPSAGARLCSLSSLCFLRLSVCSNDNCSRKNQNKRCSSDGDIWPVSLSIQTRFRRCSWAEKLRRCSSPSVGTYVSTGPWPAAKRSNCDYGR
jgi:hypothetical protein